jgi:hypothetical protein
MLDLYASDVLSLLHQTSDKRLLRMNGDGIKFLTGFKTNSSEFPDSHSERAEVRTESLLSMSINLREIVIRSKEKLIQESDRLEEASVSENQSK